MKKVFVYICLLFIVVVITTLIAGHVAIGGKKLGPLTPAVQAILDVPEVIHTLFPAEGQLPPYIKATDEKKVNHLTKDLFALHTYQEEDKAVLINLRTDSVIHTWNIGNVKESTGIRYMAVLLPGKNIIVHTENGGYLARLDAESNVLWKSHNEYQFHHSLNLDAEGNIWVCGRDRKYQEQYGMKPLDKAYFNDAYSHMYIDEQLMHFDGVTGKLLYQKSLYDLFTENHMNPFLTCYGNSGRSGDIFHLNDIEPVVADSRYLKKGDILISVRNQNRVIHYRPESGRIIKVWEKGFHAQHDVDIINDSVISIFSNNAPIDIDDLIQWKSTKPNHIIPVYSSLNFLHYNGNAILQPNVDSLFNEHHIFTITEGLVHYLPDNMLFIEEQNHFNIWVFQNGKMLYKGYFNPFTGDGYKEIPNWTNVYDHINL